MDALDAFAPPTTPPTTRPTTGPAQPSLPSAPAPAPWTDPTPRPGPSPRGRTPAVLSLACGLAAVVVAVLGVAVLSLVPVLLAATLGGGAVAAGVVALVRSRARSTDVLLVSAGGGTSALVAGVVAVTTLFLPLGPPGVGDPLATSAEAPRPADVVPADLLAGMTAGAVPPGTTVAMDGEDVAVVALRTDPVDVAARLEGMDWLRADVAVVPDLVLVELEVPVDGGGWVPVIEQGDVSVLTTEGLTYRGWSLGRSASYDVDTLLERDGGGPPRGLVVLAVPMPHAEAEDALVVVTSPSWTDMATWETTPR